MQANNPPDQKPAGNEPYTCGMSRTLTKPRPKLGAHLTELRAKAGLSQVELAQRIGVPQQNIAFWEQSDKPPRSEVLIDLADALGVRVETLLSENNHNTQPRKGGPEGKLRKIFEEASRLPRRQQEKISEFVAAFINQHKQLSAR